MDCRVEDVYASFRAELRAFLLARTGRPALAEDLVQEAFLRLARHCAKGRGCHRPRAYLYAVAASTLIDHRRSPESRVTNGTVALEDLEHRAPLPSRAGTADLESEGLGGCLMALVDGLPAAYRDAVRLADLEDLPLKEVAARLGVSLSGAKSRVQRGRSRLEKLVRAICRLERDCRGNLTRCDPQKKLR